MKGKRIKVDNGVCEGSGFFFPFKMRDIIKSVVTKAREEVLSAGKRPENQDEKVLIGPGISQACLSD